MDARFTIPAGEGSSVPVLVYAPGRAGQALRPRSTTPGDPHEAMIGPLAHSGRIIFAAGAVMVAVFFTFARSGPLPPKEMAIVLGVAVLLDASLVRLVLLPVMLRLSGHAA